MSSYASRTPSPVHQVNTKQNKANKKKKNKGAANGPLLSNRTVDHLRPSKAIDSNSLFSVGGSLMDFRISPELVVPVAFCLLLWLHVL